jgi:ATP-dependent DNA helicase RecG
LVVIDEQHRFGAGQRSKLSKKGEQTHILTMSATPIPRTLAMVLYCETDVSVIDEMPPGRQKVSTFAVDESYRERLNGFIRKQAEERHQVYIVCPAIDETEEDAEGLGGERLSEHAPTMKAAVAYAKTLSEEIFPDLPVGFLHGKMKPAEKDAVMSAFSNREADILEATTVIEVGVDVPNATLMVIEDADRFGLSQLHQLRGRVGRGKAKSFCILTSHSKNPETLQRIKAFCKTNDGFKIAEEDLALRGPGDFFGSRQSGLPVFRVANLACDLATLKQAQEASANWIDTAGTADTPEGEALRARIGQLFLRAEGTMN